MSHFYSIALSLGVSILSIIAITPREKSENIQKQNEICSERTLNMMSDLTWTGAIGTDWNDPGNWSPAEVPDSGSLTGHHVIIPVVVSGNYPVVTANSLARSVTVASGASVNIDVGGDLKVFGSDTDGYINGGTLVNNGTFRVDSSYNDAMRNLVGANITNSGVFNLNSGTGNRLENFSQITNAGNFTVGGGLGINMINHPGAVVINTGAFSVTGGLLGRVENYGKIDNFSSFRILGSLAGDGLLNQDTILNRAGATFNVSGGNARLLDNHHYILNSGNMNLVGCFPIIPNEANYNRENATFRNTAGSILNMGSTLELTFRNEGYFQLLGIGSIGSTAGSNILNDSLGVMDIYNHLNVIGSSPVGSAALVNYGVMNIGAATTLTVNNSSAAGIHNYNQINSNSGCVLTSGNLASNSIVNFEGAVFHNNCSSTFNNSAGTKIINQGRYIHNNGSLISMGGGTFLENSGYYEMNIPATFSGIPYLFLNSDSLILNAACNIITNFGYDQIFGNAAGAYLYSDAQFNITNMGSYFLENYGKTTLGPNSTFTGTSLSSTNPVILNADSLEMNGSINIRSFAGGAILNTGHLEHTGNFYAHNIAKGIQSIGGSFRNRGYIEMDSVFLSAIELSDTNYFVNTDSATLSINYSIHNGILNTSGSNFLNEGLIEIGQVDSIGLSAIHNEGNFNNRSIINIGGGKIGFHGINNIGGGNLINNGQLSILNAPNIIHGFGINNTNDFTNNYCGTVVVNKNINNTDIVNNLGFFTINSAENSTNSGTFTNYRFLNVIGGGLLPGVIEDELFQMECPENQIVNEADTIGLYNLARNPQDGIFTGPGVQDSIFVASEAGPGNHTLSYNYYFDENCFVSCTFNIEVIPANDLPPGWSQNENGIGCNNGSQVSFNDTTQVFSVSSNNCFSGPPYTSDNAAFAQYSLCGNGSITVQVTGISGSAWAGVIMRENTGTGAKKVQLTTNLQSNLVRKEVRTVTNGPAIPQQSPAFNKFWLRLVRQGNQFTGFTSANGITWSPVMASNVIMGNCIEMGLVVSNYNSNSNVTATFGNVKVVGGNVTLPVNNSNVALKGVENHTTDFGVFPNPSAGEINLELSAYLGKSIIIEILSLQGQVLQKREIKSVQQKIENFNLANKLSGTYLIKIKSEGKVDQVKPVVLNTANK
ncbi:MAG: T9SS type A sorting domain-containing protein [Saprospiraceae bacterium]|nr:T9SS type A sorting domain-containing protein [Saprospiraceae bacterium]